MSTPPPVATPASRESPLAVATAASRGAPLLPQAEAPRQAVVPWSARVLDLVSSYLPVLLMALVALGTWWLVKNTPLFEGARPAVPLRHEPDYTMSQFTVQRFTPAGALSGQLEGDTLRHYPDTDTIEVDNPRIRAIGLDGGLTRATAQRALSNADGSEVQLMTDAHVVREATPKQAAIDFRGEFLHAFLATERVQSHLPVVVTQGSTEVHAGGMVYDNLARVVEFKGKTRAVFSPPSPATRGGRK